MSLLGYSVDEEVWAKKTMEILDETHKRETDLTDEIYVINVGGYIGASSRSENEHNKIYSKMGQSKTERLLRLMQKLSGPQHYKTGEINVYLRRINNLSARILIGYTP